MLEIPIYKSKQVKNKILHLNLKKEYFDDIKNGKKEFEYRLFNDYWKKRLLNIDYEEVHFKLGYPKNDDNEKIIKCKYNGWLFRGIRHKHFNNTGATDRQVEVFCIFTNGKRLKDKQKWITYTNAINADLEVM